jgi:hypothetical protein
MMAFGRVVFANGNGIPDHMPKIALVYCVSSARMMNIKHEHNGAN